MTTPLENLANQLADDKHRLRKLAMRHKSGAPGLEEEIDKLGRAIELKVAIAEGMKKDG